MSSFLSAIISIIRKKRQPPGRVSHNFHCFFRCGSETAVLLFFCPKERFFTNRVENLVNRMSHENVATGTAHKLKVRKRR
jgi:hypothetical protein